MTDNQLGVLMGTYFHEDFEGLDATLEEYLRVSFTEHVVRLVEDIDAFLIATPIDEVPAALKALGSYAWLGESPDDYVAWLRSIRRSAAQRLLDSASSA